MIHTYVYIIIADRTGIMGHIRNNGVYSKNYISLFLSVEIAKSKHIMTQIYDVINVFDCALLKIYTCILLKYQIDRGLFS